MILYFKKVSLFKMGSNSLIAVCGVFVAVTFAVVMVVLQPLLVIWALNILFKSNIDYSLLTWVAASILTNSGVNLVKFGSKKD